MTIWSALGGRDGGTAAFTSGRTVTLALDARARTGWYRTVDVAFERRGGRRAAAVQLHASEPVALVTLRAKCAAGGKGESRTPTARAYVRVIVESARDGKVTPLLRTGLRTRRGAWRRRDRRGDEGRGHDWRLPRCREPKPLRARARSTTPTLGWRSLRGHGAATLDFLALAAEGESPEPASTAPRSGLAGARSFQSARKSREGGEGARHRHHVSTCSGAQRGTTGLTWSRSLAPRPAPGGGRGRRVDRRQRHHRRGRDLGEFGCAGAPGWHQVPDLTRQLLFDKGINYLRSSVRGASKPLRHSRGRHHRRHVSAADLARETSETPTGGTIVGLRQHARETFGAARRPRSWRASGRCGSCSRPR